MSMFDQYDAEALNSFYEHFKDEMFLAYKKKEKIEIPFVIDLEKFLVKKTGRRFQAKFCAVGCQGVRGFSTFHDWLAKRVKKQQKIGENISKDQTLQFTFLLGDNFYNNGVTRVNDSRFSECFEDIYKGLNFAVLGNHDYAIHSHVHVKLEKKRVHKYRKPLDRAHCQVMRTYDKGCQSLKGKIGAKPIWVMPNRYYCLVSDFAYFFVVDSNSLLWDEAQQVWLKTVYENLPYQIAPFVIPRKILVLHHPMVTNGKRRYKQGDIKKYQEIFKSSTDPNRIGSLNDALYEYLDKEGYFFHIVLAAHDHLLSLNKIKWKSQPNRNFLQITSGAGGGNLQSEKEVASNRYRDSYVWLRYGYATIDLHRNTYELLDHNGEQLIETVFKKDLDVKKLFKPRGFFGITDAEWVPDKQWQHCQLCSQKFTLTTRRHHCRFCGGLVCNKCSRGRRDEKRVCDACVKLPDVKKQARVHVQQTDAGNLFRSKSKEEEAVSDHAKLTGKTYAGRVVKDVVQMMKEKPNISQRPKNELQNEQLKSLDEMYDRLMEDLNNTPIPPAFADGAREITEIVLANAKGADKTKTGYNSLVNFVVLRSISPMLMSHAKGQDWNQTQLTISTILQRHANRQKFPVDMEKKPGQFRAQNNAKMNTLLDKYKDKLPHYLINKVYKQAGRGSSTDMDSLLGGIVARKPERRRRSIPRKKEPSLELREESQPRRLTTTLSQQQKKQAGKIYSFLKKLWLEKEFHSIAYYEQGSKKEIIDHLERCDTKQKRKNPRNFSRLLQLIRESDERILEEVNRKIYSPPE